MVDYLSAKGWITQKERILLHKCALDLPPSSNILNIGIEYGASMACLTVPDVNLYGVDIIGNDLMSVRLDATIYKKDSRKLYSHWRKPLHFIFVDGEHSISGVLADARFASFLERGCKIAFHDCSITFGTPTAKLIVEEVNKAVNIWYNTAIGFIEIEGIDSIRMFIKASKSMQKRINIMKENMECDSIDLLESVDMV